MPTLPTGTVTFLFTDIEGSTKLWEEHPETMRLALARHDTLLRAAIERHEGHVFKTMGDAFCAAFHTAPEALHAAFDAQQALRGEVWPEPVTIKVRMALHTGAAESRDNDYFGQPLNRVARLLGAGHGGQALISAVVQELTRDTLPPGCALTSLGEHRLRDLIRPEVVFQLAHPALPADFAPLKSLDNAALPNNLPQQVTSFIGRAKEMAEVRKLLEKSRLLTLTGSGGCGKTRLSLQVAADVLEAYPDGVWLVEFAPLADSGLIVQTVMQALGVKEQAGQPLLHTLTENLKAKRLLLVLDNCEHVLSLCAHLIAELLRACPDVKVLATSREALGIGGEQTYRVPSLSLPDPKLPSSPQSVSQYESVRLFIERALLVKPDFAVTNANAPSLAQLCAHLDGIPLAIELAAARVRSLPVEDINTRLDNRFRLLTGGNRAALPRQQTLRALIDWSYDLLNAQEKLMLERLSVFAGGWNLAAAEQVCSEEGIEEWEALDLLTGLADKSLVIAEDQGVSERYRMLETMRQYAAERLLARGETAQVKTRHRDTFLALAEEAVPQLRGPEQQRWLERLEEEHDNLLAALVWCHEETNGGKQGAETGLRLAGAVFWFWERRGCLDMGRTYLAQALSQDAAQKKTTTRARVLIGAGRLAFCQRDYRQAQLLLEEALLILRELEDEQGLSGALNELGNLTSDQGNYTEARALYEESLAIRRRLNDQPGTAAVLNNLAITEQEQGNQDQARRLYEEALGIQRALGDTHGIAKSLGNLAMVLSDQGLYAQSYAFQTEALAMKRVLGDRIGIAFSLDHLGNVVYQQGDVGQAQNLQAEALAIRRELGDKRGVADSLHNLGSYAHLRGDAGEAQSYYTESLFLRREIGDRLGICDSFEALADRLPLGEAEKAARLCGCAQMLREAIGAPLAPDAREQHDRQIARSRAALGDDAFSVAWEEGRAMPLEQAVTYALAEK